MSNTKSSQFTNDREFLRVVQQYEDCCDRHSDGRWIDYTDCDRCPLLDDCRAAWDARIDILRDKPVSSKDASRLDKQRRGLKRQLQLC